MSDFVQEGENDWVDHLVEMPCLNVTHNEIDCSHLPKEQRCESCRAKEQISKQKD